MTEEEYSEFKVLLDTPSKSPSLGFADYAQVLKDIILQNDPQFAIGIFGSWGSGKTTLMRQISSLLEDEGAIRVDFSAWRYERENHLIIPLLDTIREALLLWARENRKQRKTLSKSALEMARVLGKILTALAAGFDVTMGVPGATQVSFKANEAISLGRSLLAERAEASVTPRSFYHASFNALRQAAAKNCVGVQRIPPIVVFIDDLDRCFPESALEVLESMKLFFDFRGFVFVVALDEEVISSTIDYKLRRRQGSPRQKDTSLESTGANYIQKIFQIPFYLPTIAITQLEEFLQATCQVENVPQAQRSEIRGRVARHLLRAFPAEQLARAGINPRQVKRYINSYTLQMRIKPQLDPDAVLALQTMRVQPEWSRPWLLLRSRKRLFLDALKRYIDDGDDSGLADAGITKEDIAPSFIEYVSDTGRALLRITERLDEYLHSGELQSDKTVALAADMYAKAGDLKRLIQKAFSDASTRQQDSNPSFEPLRSLYSAILEESFRILSEFEQGKRVRNELSAALAAFDNISSSTPNWHEVLIVPLSHLQQLLEGVVSGRVKTRVWSA